MQETNAEIRTSPEKEGEKVEVKLENLALEEKEALANRANEVLSRLADVASGNVADDAQAKTLER